MTDRYRIYAWRGSDFQAFNTAPGLVEVAYNHAEDLLGARPSSVRVGRWDGLQVVDISDPIPWDDRPRRLT